MSSAELGNLVVRLGLEDSKFTNGIQKINKSMNVLKSEMKVATSQFKNFGGGIDGLKAKSDILNRQFDLQKKKVEELNGAHKESVAKKGEDANATQNLAIKLNNAISEMNKIGSELNKVNGEIDKQTSKWGKLQDSLKNVSSKFTDIGKKATSVGKSMALKVTAPVAALGGVAIKASNDFTDAIAKVSTISDEGEVSIGELRKGILDLSNDTGIASSEIANNVYDAISSGQKTGDAVNFVANSTKLAKAGFADAGQSLDLLTTIMNGYKMSAGEVTNVSDLLIKVQDKGKVTVGELSESMGKIIKTADVNKVSLDQLGAGYALMTSNGIRAAESTTYMSSMLNELGKSGTKASDALKQATGKSFQELMASGKSLGDVLSELDNYAKKNSLSMADMFGSAEAGKAALVLADNAGRDFNEMLKEMNNSTGATEEAFKKLQTPGEKFRITINKAKNELIKFGDVMAPVFEGVINVVSKVVEVLSGMDDSTRKIVVTIALVAAAIGPLLIGIGNVISSIGAISKAFSMVTKAGMLLTGKIALIVAAVAGLIYIGYKIYENWDEIANTAKWVWNSIKDFVVNNCEYISNKVTEIWEGIKGFFKNNWTYLGNLARDTWEGIKGFFSNLWQGIKDIFFNGIGSINNFVAEKFGFMKDSILDIFNGIKLYIDGVWMVIKNIFLGVVLIILDIVTLNFSKLKTDIANIWTNIKEGFSLIWEGIKMIFISYLTIIKDFIKVIFDTVANEIIFVWESIKNFFVNNWLYISNKAYEMWEGMKQTISNTVTGTKTWIVDTWNSIVEWFSTLPDRLWQKGVDMFTSLKNGIASLYSDLKSSISTGIDNALEYLKNLPKSMYDWGKNAISGFIDGIKSMFGAIGDAASGAAEKVRDFLGFNSPAKKGPGRFITVWGKNMISGFMDGIEQQTPALQSLMNKTLSTQQKAEFEVTGSNRGKKGMQSIGENVGNGEPPTFILNLQMGTKVIREVITPEVDKEGAFRINLAERGLV